MGGVHGGGQERRRERAGWERWKGEREREGVHWGDGRGMGMDMGDGDGGLMVGHGGVGEGGVVVDGVMECMGKARLVCTSSCHELSPRKTKPHQPFPGGK